MKRVDASGHSSNLFVDKDSGGGIPGTTLEKTWHNNVQEEIAGLIESESITLDGTDYTQLNTAVNSKIQNPYTIGTAGSVAGAAHNSLSYDVSGDTIAPAEITYGDSYTKMYVCGGTVAYQYDTTTAGSADGISALSYSFDFTAQITTLHGLAFNTDGTKVFALDVSGNVYRYTLTTAWRISTAGYDTHTTSTPTGQITQGRTLKFNTETVTLGATPYIAGRLMYIGEQKGAGNDTIEYYSLASAFDLTTVNNEGNLAVHTEFSSISGFDFCLNMSKIIAVGDSTEVQEYSYDVSDGSILHVATADSTTYFDATISGIAMLEDGTRGVIIGATNDTIFDYILAKTYSGQSIAYSVGLSWGSTAGFNSAGNIGGPVSNDACIYLGSSNFLANCNLFQVRYDTGDKYQVRLPTADTWDDWVLMNVSNAVGGGREDSTMKIDIEDNQTVNIRLWDLASGGVHTAVAQYDEAGGAIFGRVRTLT